jgi:hypothetical protein
MTKEGIDALKNFNKFCELDTDFIVYLDNNLWYYIDLIYVLIIFHF